MMVSHYASSLFSFQLLMEASVLENSILRFTSWNIVGGTGILFKIIRIKNKDG